MEGEIGLPYGVSSPPSPSASNSSLFSFTRPSRKKRLWLMVEMDVFWLGAHRSPRSSVHCCRLSFEDSSFGRPVACITCHSCSITYLATAIACVYVYTDVQCVCTVQTEQINHAIGTAHLSPKVCIAPQPAAAQDVGVQSTPTKPLSPAGFPL